MDHASPQSLAEADERAEPECRICRCTAEEAGEMLFAPCLCKGSLEWVHPSCLEQWRAACPPVASRLRCDMCRGGFMLEQHRPGCRDVCAPCAASALHSVGVVLLVELATCSSGFFVNALAMLTGVPAAHYTFRPGFDLHLNGWTLLLPQAAIWTVVRKLRASHLQLVEANPGYVGGWWSRNLFEKRSEAGCALSVFTIVLLGLLVPMGYLGKALIWLANEGWEGLDEEQEARGAVAGLSESGEVSWRIDPAHFYVASLVFCMASFVLYLVGMTVLFARQHPDRLGCCKVIAAVLAFEGFVILGGYLVKILAVLTGVYGRNLAAESGEGGSGFGNGDGSEAAGGWGAVEWSADWNHHVLSLTAWMPVVHSVFFLQRFRLVFPRWKEAYPQAPCIGCLTRVLETWSTSNASVFIALLSLLLIHIFGLGGKLLLSAATGLPMSGRSSSSTHRSDQDVSGGQPPPAAEGGDEAGERTGGTDERSREEFAFGWGTDYTHYFIGFVLLYLSAALTAALFGLYARYHSLADAGGSTVRTDGTPRQRPPQQQPQQPPQQPLPAEARP